MTMMAGPSAGSVGVSAGVSGTVGVSAGVSVEAGGVSGVPGFTAGTSGSVDAAAAGPFRMTLFRAL